VSAYNAANVDIPNGVIVQIPFDTERYDVGGYHSTSVNPQRFTVPSGKAGYYCISFEAVHATSTFANTGNWEVEVLINGNQVGNSFSPMGVWDSLSIQMVRYLNVGDYVTIQVNHTAASTLILYVGSTNGRFEMFKAGD
jgi:hypothetical protein